MKKIFMFTQFNLINIFEIFPHFANASGNIQLLRYHKSIRIWTLSPPPFSPCSHLFDFGKSLSYRESLKLYISPLPTPYKNSKL